jgi:hypothetical protein
MPPKVLPAVATQMAAQNSSGLSLISPNTAGSEPKGSKVAEMNETINTVDRPISGSDSQPSNRAMCA